MNSNWVLEEADRGPRRRVLIPAFIERVEPPLGFSSIQAADLSDWVGDRQVATPQRFFGDVAGILGAASDVDAGYAAQVAANRKVEEQQRQQAEAEAKRRVEEQRRQARTEAKSKAEEQPKQARSAAFAFGYMIGPLFTAKGFITLTIVIIVLIIIIARLNNQ